MADLETITDSVLSLNSTRHHTHPIVWLSIVPLILSVIIAVTVIGNIFVVIAFFRDARIRSTVSNFFILNLAVTDLLVGSFVMTTYLAEEIADQWHFGETFCKILSTVDFVLTMMSSLTMLLISWDRYCLLSMGMAYKTYQTRKRIGITLLIMWISCLLFFSTLSFGWKHIFGMSGIDFALECEMEFLTNLTATVIINVIEFAIPFTLLIILNMLVYNKIKGRSLGAVGQSPDEQMPGNPAVENGIGVISIPHKGNVSRENKSVPECSDMSTIHLSASPAIVYSQVASERCGGIAEERRKRPRAVFQENNTLQVSQIPADVKAQERGNNVKITTDATPVTFAEGQQKNRPPAHKAKRILAKHRKAAVVLTVLSSCYLLCYLPYNICSIAFAICKFECTNDLIWTITAYLLWCNSTINPFIYATTNIHFRRNFRHFLLLDRWKCDVKRCQVKRHHGNQDHATFADTVHDTQQ